jgi:DNA-binding transcriptional regulator PaaX
MMKPFLSELEKRLAKRIVQKGGRVSRSELEGMLREVGIEKGLRIEAAGIIPRLLDEGFLVKVRVPGMGAIYALSAEGAKKTGIIPEASERIKEMKGMKEGSKAWKGEDEAL